MSKESSETTLKIALEIKKLNDGDASARGRLVELVNERLQMLTRQMLQGYPEVKSHVGASDVAQEATIRLIKALEKVKLESVLHFLNLATLEIRRELMELARKFTKRPKMLPFVSPAGDQSSASSPTPDPAETTNEPHRLARWTEFHEKVGDLPERERQVFELWFYQGLLQPDIANLIKMSNATVGRDLRSARIKLHDMLGGDVPTWA